MVGYESAWRCHIVDAFGGLEIDSITAGMIETWMAGMPRGAARKAWGVLRTMLRKAFRWGMSSVDVTTRVRGPKRTDHQPRMLDSRQIATLLRGFWGHELEAWLICSVRSKYRLHLMGQSICSLVLKLLSQVESWKSIFNSIP